MTKTEKIRKSGGKFDRTFFRKTPIFVEKLENGVNQEVESTGKAPLHRIVENRDPKYPTFFDQK